MNKYRYIKVTFYDDMDYKHKRYDIDRIYRAKNETNNCELCLTNGLVRSDIPNSEEKYFNKDKTWYHTQWTITKLLDDKAYIKWLKRICEEITYEDLMIECL